MKIRLRDTFDNNLWKKDLFTIKLEYIINSNIYEYDIGFAGYNLAKYYGLLDKKTLEYLASINKSDAHIQIGRIQRDNESFAKDLSNAFRDMRRIFFIENNIDENSVVSIRKDAIFLINKQCTETTFKNIEFVLKNRFTSFHTFGKYEFYYRNRGNILAVKGISDDKLIDHNRYMLSFLKDIFNLLETSDNQRIVDKIKRFASLYKQGELDYRYYRKLSSTSMYDLSYKDADSASFESVEPLKGFNINKNFNYINYIHRLIQRYFFISGV